MSRPKTGDQVPQSAAAAEAGIGGLYEHHAFLQRWGSSGELAAGRDAVAELCRLFLVGPPFGEDHDTRTHLSAVLDRLQRLYAAARIAEAELGKLGLVFDTGSRQLMRRTGRRGPPRRLLSVAVEHEYRRAVENGAADDTARKLVHHRLAGIWHPTLLSAKSIDTIIGNQVKQNDRDRASRKKRTT